METSTDARERRREERKARHKALKEQRKGRGTAFTDKYDPNVKKNLTGKGTRIAGKPDELVLEGQQYAVISFVTPKTERATSDRIFMKFRGAFATPEDADAWAAKVHEADPDFDVHIVRMWNWIEIPPSEEIFQKIPRKYAEEGLDKIVRDHYANIERGNEAIRQRRKAAEKEAKRKMKKHKHKQPQQPQATASTSDPKGKARVPVEEQ